MLSKSSNVGSPAEGEMSIPRPKPPSEVDSAPEIGKAFDGASSDGPLDGNSAAPATAQIKKGIARKLRMKFVSESVFFVKDCDSDGVIFTWLRHAKVMPPHLLWQI